MHDTGKQAKAVLFILNYNGTKFTCDLLESLRKIGFPYPVWVVDNGSERDDSTVFQSTFPGVVVKRIENNCGFAGGVNRAMKMAAGAGFGYAYEINNDTLAEDDFVSPCVEIMNRRPDVDIVGSRFRNFNPQTGEFSIWGYHSRPEEAKTFPDGFLETRHVSGCGMLLRVKTFIDFGGLDERFFCYGEENDYCYRLAKAGRKQGISAKSHFLHQGSATNDSVWRSYFAARNTILFSRKHDSSWQDSGKILVKLVLIPGWKGIINRKRWMHVAAAGHGMADALCGRYGKRAVPFRKAIGIPLFLILSPLVFAYALAISAAIHPWRSRPIP